MLPVALVGWVVTGNKFDFGEYLTNGGKTGWFPLTNDLWISPGENDWPGMITFGKYMIRDFKSAVKNTCHFTIFLIVMLFLFCILALIAGGVYLYGKSKGDW